MMRVILFTAIFLFPAAVVAGSPPAPKGLPRVVMETPLGPVVAEINTDKAPLTAGNFLRYVDEGRYQKASFYRAVRHDNDEHQPKITVLEGGIDPTCLHAPLPPIAHESTKLTGLKHTDGALSAVRWDPGSATSEFFIVIGDTPELDFGGKRNPDGQGFAVFGHIVEGMDIVRRINDGRTGTNTTIEFLKTQGLQKPIPVRIVRISGVR